MKNILSVLLIILIASACANKRPLTGGEKDTTPPSFDIAIPENKSTNINPNKITLIFDEQIDNNDIENNLFITPYIDNPFEAKVKRNKLYLEFEKTFEENTTYTLFLDNCIMDITEKNKSKNLKYVFSTGDNIDSLKLSAQVIDPFIQKPYDKILVSVYKVSDTNTITNSKPLYFGYTNKDGEVTIENMKEDQYEMFALVDLNNNYTYDENEIVAFTDSIYTPDTLEINSTLYPITIEKKLKQKIKSIRNIDNTFQLNLTNEITNYDLVDTNYSNYESTYWFSGKYEINITINDTLFEGYIITQDSLNQTDTLDIELRANKKSKWFVFTSKKVILKPYENIEFKLSNKPNLIVDSLLYFVVDSSKVKNTGWKLDSNRNVLIIFPPKELISYELHIDSLAVQNDRIHSRDYKKTFKTYQETETGSISGKINCNENFIIQLLDKSYKLIEEKKNINKYTFDYLQPNTYKMRLILDNNNNGVWDRGNFENRELPEEIIFHNSKITLRKNWEIKDINISCPQ